MRREPSRLVREICRAFCGYVLIAGCAREASEPPQAKPPTAASAGIAAKEHDLATSRTFSIVAVEPDSGVCAVAVASKYPAVGAVVPFARGGIGAFCTQHVHHASWGPRALDLLGMGLAPQDVLQDLLRDDAHAGLRQLAIIDNRGRTAQHNPAQADEDSRWWGALSGRNYACQGNTLCGVEVLASMASAFESTPGTLADRMVAALVAGDCAGGDRRGRLAAAILVAKPGQDAWLDLRVDDSQDAVLDLARKYVELQHDAKGRWSDDKRPWQHPCPRRPELKPPAQ